MPFLPAFRQVAVLTLVALPVCAFSTLSAAEPASETSAFTHPINIAEDAPLVELNGNGLLRYALYSERGSDHARNIVPDFSRAGYQGGGVGLTTRSGIPVIEILEPNAEGDGWAGAQQMFWNTEHDIYVVQAPPFAMNWSVGRVGAIALGRFPPEEPAGIVQSVGHVVHLAACTCSS